MTDGAGADAIGSWYGTGPVRGLALMFSVAGLLGVLVTGLGMVSRPYRRLRAAEAEAMADGSSGGPAPDAPAGDAPTTSPANPSVIGAAGAPVPAG